MKKILSIIMVVIMTLGLPIYSQASEGETITQDSEEKSGNTNIDYNMEKTYTVVFPASVTFTDSNKTIERPLEVRDVALREGSSLSINVASPNNFQMKNNEGYITYQMFVNYNSDAVKNNSTVLVVDAGKSSGWAVLEFKTSLDKSKASYAGRYADTLTFTVSID